ncbi:hypothetical protein Anapl_01934, partial [Anas platyrhynchos]
PSPGISAGQSWPAKTPGRAGSSVIWKRVSEERGQNREGK